MTRERPGAAIHGGVFREDLIARLSLRYTVPTLRARREEIMGIAHRYLREKGEETGVAYGATKGAAYRLRSHDWPGNIRELLNVLAYCTIFAKDGLIPLDLVEKAIQNQQVGTKPMWDEMAEPPQPKSDEDKRRELIGKGRME